MTLHTKLYFSFLKFKFTLYYRGIFVVKGDVDIFFSLSQRWVIIQTCAELKKSKNAAIHYWNLCKVRVTIMHIIYMRAFFCFAKENKYESRKVVLSLCFLPFNHYDLLIYEPSPNTTLHFPNYRQDSVGRLAASAPQHYVALWLIIWRKHGYNRVYTHTIQSPPVL